MLIETKLEIREALVKTGVSFGKGAALLRGVTTERGFVVDTGSVGMNEVCNDVADAGNPAGSLSETARQDKEPWELILKKEESFARLRSL